MYIIKENTEALVVASKGIALEVKPDNTSVHGHVSRSEYSTKSQHKDR
jgi:hypothetical protein